MGWSSPSTRISFSLVGIVTCILLFALACRLIPDFDGLRLEQRKNFCEQLAMSCSLAAQHNDIQAMTDIVRAAQQSQRDIRAVVARGADGKILAAAGEPWKGGATAEQVRIPIVLKDQQPASVDIYFQPIHAGGITSMFRHPVLPFVLFFGLTSFLAFFLFVRMTFRHISFAESRVVPDQVKDTLNSLAEGVVILDKEGRIILANNAFAAAAGQAAADLEGRKVSELGWTDPLDELDDSPLPWEFALEGKKPQTGKILELDADGKHVSILSVNAMPIVATDGSLRGALASFDDLTVIEKKNAHLKRLLAKLQKSRTEIQKQNQQLRDLATRDSLTGCLNRRAFFAEFESQWNASQRYGHPLSCMMLDVDHFKPINDMHGHLAGDQALQQIAVTLQQKTRNCDLICRYGGEEFCLLLPHLDLDDAAQAAERIRAEIEQCRPAGVAITVSIGISALSLGAKDGQELLDQADKALYAAKRRGRNCVVRWDQIPPDQMLAGVGGHVENAAQEHTHVSIPFHAVTALLSALAYRHTETAEHSRRVADLCVATANGLLSLNDRYVLEVAALLHDVGKLGVPDAILLKPAQLTEEEWKIIRTHKVIGEEIISAAFSSEKLTEIIRFHNFPFHWKSDNPAIPHGNNLPLGARILAIADAFDSMISDQVYRVGRSRKEAFAELRRCAGEQFDPELVERFIQTVQDRDQDRCSRPALSKPSALQIGLQIEKLAIAADIEDRDTLLHTATHLHAIADKHSITPIADLARQLKNAVQSGTEMDELMELILLLIEHCRSAYEAYIPREEAATA